MSTLTECVQCADSGAVDGDGYCPQCAREYTLIEAMRSVVGPGPITMRLTAVGERSMTWRFEAETWAVLEVGT